MSSENEAYALSTFVNGHVPCTVIGETTAGEDVKIRFNGVEVLAEDVRALRDMWEETSFQLDHSLLDCNYLYMFA